MKDSTANNLPPNSVRLVLDPTAKGGVVHFESRSPDGNVRTTKLLDILPKSEPGAAEVAARHDSQDCPSIRALVLAMLTVRIWEANPARLLALGTLTAVTRGGWETFSPSKPSGDSFFKTLVNGFDGKASIPGGNPIAGLLAKLPEFSEWWKAPRSRTKAVGPSFHVKQKLEKDVNVGYATSRPNFLFKRSGSQEDIEEVDALLALAEFIEECGKCGKWSDKVFRPSTAAPLPLPEPLAPPVRAYLAAVASACDVVWFPGLKDQGERHLFDIYADLHTREPSEDPEADSQFRANEHEKRERFPALKAAAEHKALVILGPPGGGKSTFLRYLAIRLARRYSCAVEGPAGADTEKTLPQNLLRLVPIWIDLPSLKDIPESAPEDADPLWLWDTFVKGLGELNGVPEPKPDMAGPLREIVESGRALFLFDGLDEITEPDQRDFLKAAIRKFACEAFGGVKNRMESRMIVTCRERSWFTGWSIDDWPKSSPLKLAVRTLTGFTKEDQAGFLTGWFRANGSEKPDKEAQQLGVEIRDPVRNRGGRLEEMASSPLTLSMIAWLHSRPDRENRSLPASRAAIYEQTIHAILWHLDDHKTGEAAATTLPRLVAQKAKASGLTRQKFLATLAKIAFEAQKLSPVRGLADISSPQLDAEFAKLSCPATRSAPAIPEKQWATAVRCTIQCRSGLLREIQWGTYRFQHRSFQEYLAAYHLATQEHFTKQSLDWRNQQLPTVEGDNEEEKREAVEANRESLWEVLRLAVGHLAVPKEQRAEPDPDPGRDRSKAMDLLFALIEVPEGKTPRNWRDVWLGGELLEELNLGENLAGGWKLLGSNARAALVALIEDGALTPYERAAAARSLGRLGDPRKGVGIRRGKKGEITDMFEWLPIPTESPAVATAGGPNSSTAGEPEFFVSRYLVTVAQYESFVRDGGYCNPEWWQTPEATAWLKGKRSPGPEAYDDLRLQTPNNPQVGVCFHEAQAFCAWATTRVLPSLRLPFETDTERPWKVQLPTEEQWERAAAGGTRRTYAWGEASEKELADHCNCEMSGIGATSAVGIFPNGRSWSDTDDMTGNVWEWTDSWYDSEDGTLVLRGGSWFNRNPENLRVAYRLNPPPEYRVNHIGFRCVLVHGSLPRTGL